MLLSQPSDKRGMVVGVESPLAVVGGVVQIAQRAVGGVGEEPCVVAAHEVAVFGRGLQRFPFERVEAPGIVELEAERTGVVGSLKGVEGGGPLSHLCRKVGVVE